MAAMPSLPKLVPCLFALLFCPVGPAPAGAAEATGLEDPGAAVIQKLAADFFEWRRAQQPAGGDDIPRVERPDGWIPDWSAEALQAYRRQYREFLRAVDRLDTSEWSVASQVDARLLRAESRLGRHHDPPGLGRGTAGDRRDS